MRCLRFLLFAAALLPMAALGQQPPSQKLQEAYSLQRQGQFRQVIATLPPLLDSHDMTPLELGQAWTILAFAFEMEGNYNKAGDAYQQALQILESDQSFAKDYAIALQNFANLYKDTGQGDSAFNLDKKALTLFQNLHDADGIARSCVSLGNLELLRKKMRQSGQYLAMAQNFAAQSTHLDADYYADFNLAKARYDEMTGNRTASLSEYQKALDLWKVKHGPEHMIIGWGYMLLGTAEDRAGERQNAVNDMQQGLGMLEHTLGPHSPKCLLAKIAYSRVLIKTGKKKEGTAMFEQANDELKSSLHIQCVDCRVSVSALD